MKKELNVIVQGTTKTGKSTIILALIKALKQYDVEMTLDSPDYNNSIDAIEDTMEQALSLEDRLNVIGDNIKVNIVEQQLK